MKYVWLGCLLFGSQLFGGTQDSEFNVNTRYTVDAVMLAGDGWTTNLVSDRDRRISSSLRRQITSLIGQKLNPAALDDLAKRLRKEFRARAVEHRVMRGKTPEFVQVVFEVKMRPSNFDIAIPKFAYNSSQGVSGALEATAGAKGNVFTAGVLSDGDDLLERFTGVEARYENTHLGTNRIHFSFEFDDFHDQWNQSTAEGLAAQNTNAALGASRYTSDLYRSRQNFEPLATFELSRSLRVSLGASFERLEDEYLAGRTQAANAVLASVRYHDRLEGANNQTDLDAGYDLRAASKSLGSDFVYSRNRWEFRYTLTRGRQVFLDDFTAGIINGRAPLYDRFALGNSSTLRGWNKYDLDPFGGNRMIHNSVEYRYGAFQAFYDSGAVWDGGETIVPRNSVGVGLREGAYSVAVAFPVREGRIDPVFMVGMNY